MSTNYYLRTRDTELAFDLAPRVIMDIEKRYFEIHLCQIQDCFKNVKPLFETHSYQSFSDLRKLLISNKSFWIVDEYGRKISVEDFIAKMVKENNNNTRTVSDTNVFIDKDGFEWLDCDFV